MLWLALAAMILSAFSGIVLMEAGSPALNFIGVGHANGAAIAYASFTLLLLASAFATFRMFRGFVRLPETPAPARMSAAHFRRLAIVVITANVALVMFTVFVAGSWRVLAGQMDRGVFRATLGGFGAYAFLARDFLAPMALAVVAFVYRRCAPRVLERALLIAAIGVTAANSASWGYKASALFAVMPAFVLLFPTIRVRNAIGLVAAGVVTVIGSSMLFEQRSLPEAAFFVLSRATVGAGDAAWKLWELRDQGAFPPWAPTLLGALGGKLAGLLGSWTRGGTDWYATDFSATASWVVKDFNRTLEAGMSNVTSTAFGEGVFALGSPGFLLFAVLGGVILGAIRGALYVADRRHMPLLAGAAATYFGYSYLSWVNSGGLVTLINIPHLISYAIGSSLVFTYLILAGIVRVDFRASRALARDPIPL